MSRTERGGRSGRGRGATHRVPPDHADLFGVLRHGGHLTENGVALARAFAERWQISPFDSILETRLMSEANLADALAAALGVDRLHHLTGLVVPEETVAAVPFALARAGSCLILRDESDVSAEEARLDLVLADPTQRDLIERIRKAFGAELTLAVAERSVVVKAVDELYPLAAQLPTLLG